MCLLSIDPVKFLIEFLRPKPPSTKNTQTTSLGYFHNNITTKCESEYRDFDTKFFA